MKISLILLSLFSFQLFAQDHNSFPIRPDPTLTPGELCTNPSRYRYSERIAYCERDVQTKTKNMIREKYRSTLGYKLSGERLDYKIDHYIPLCAGGSNSKLNLWPQHKSIYVITDPIESLGCNKLNLGLITQKEVVELIMYVKNNLSYAPEAIKYLHSLR